MKRKTLEQLEHMAQLFELPLDAAVGSVRIEIQSCRQALITNHDGIIEYSSEYVSVNTKPQAIKITGNDLLIGAMNKSSLKVTGVIKAVEFI